MSEKAKDAIVFILNYITNFDSQPAAAVLARNI